jgi:hypothetical protein
MVGPALVADSGDLAEERRARSAMRAILIAAIPTPAITEQVILCT